MNHAGAMYGFAANLNGGQNGECADYVQNVFEGVTRNWAQLTPRTNEQWRAYLIGAMRKQVIGGWRSQKSTRDVMQKLQGNEALREGHPDPLTLDVDTELYKQCMGLIQSLPPQQRRIAYLSFVLEFSRAEVADYLGVASSTVRVTVHQLKKQFKKLQDDFNDTEL